MLRPHRLGDAAEILGHDVPVALGLEIVFLQRAIFGRARHEGGLQPEFLRGLQIVVVGGHHHHLLRRQAQKFCRAEIGFGIGLVVLEQLGRHDQVPRQACKLRHVGEQRDIAVGERRDDVFCLQPRQPRDAVRPRMQPMPAHREMVQIGVGQSLDPELLDQFFQRAAVQHVEDHIAAFGMLAHLVHRGGVDRAPAVDQRGPVGLDAARLRPCGEIIDQAGAPIDHGAEHVEHQRFDGGNIGHAHSLSSLLSFRARAARTRNLEFPICNAMGSRFARPE